MWIAYRGHGLTRGRRRERIVFRWLTTDAEGEKPPFLTSWLPRPQSHCDKLALSFLGRGRTAVSMYLIGRRAG